MGPLLNVEKLLSGMSSRPYQSLPVSVTTDRPRAVQDSA